MTGDEKCQECPMHSKAPDFGLAECRCNTGYYRAAIDPKDMPCTRELLIYTKYFRIEIEIDTS